MKMDQKFLSIDYDPGSELSGSLVADRKLVQRIQVPHATAERGVAVALMYRVGQKNVTTFNPYTN